MRQRFKPQDNIEPPSPVLLWQYDGYGRWQALSARREPGFACYWNIKVVHTGKFVACLLLPTMPEMVGQYHAFEEAKAICQAKEDFFRNPTLKETAK
jgi:hypothetical protein